MKATRTTAAVLSAAMAATLLAGCGGSSATSTAASTSTESRCGCPHRRETDPGVLVSLR